MPAGERHRHEKARTAVSKNVTRGTRGVAGMKRHGHQAVGERCLIKGNRIEGIRQQHCHTVALRKAHLCKGLAPAQHALGKLTPGNRDPFVGGKVIPPVGLTVGPDPYGAVQKIRNDAGFFRETRQSSAPYSQPINFTRRREWFSRPHTPCCEKLREPKGKRDLPFILADPIRKLQFPAVVSDRTLPLKPEYRLYQAQSSRSGAPFRRQGTNPESPSGEPVPQGARRVCGCARE